ncbi:ABC transporter substrate-binding protein [Actinophytocola sp.]|uniref:ABC transporter substrate-binding protein n=1 Tax=Actinophytocola sp. TaxID=1872138 RepID=UPI002ED34D7E
MRREFRRRTLLRTAALTPLAGLAAGCGRIAGIGDLTRVAVTWSAAEFAAFEDVLAGRGVQDYEVIPFGDDISAAFGARTAGRPDVVAVPQVGHVRANLDNLAPLPEGVWDEQYTRIWSGALVGDRHYALPFKLANVSVVWYRKDLDITPPKTWDDWLALNEELIDNGVTPLALGGADGWVLAQFFENVLLRTYPVAFDALAGPDHEANLWTSREVRGAFEMVARMWGQAGALSGGASNALVQQFPDAVLEMCTYRRAAMVAMPDFAESVIRRFAPDPEGFDTFTFPPGGPGDPPLAVSSDLLVLTRPASGAAQDLIRYLATPKAPVPWIRDTGGFIAANPGTDDRYYSPTLRKLAKALAENDIRFGLADSLGRLGGGEGLQGVLRDLLRGVADGIQPEEAARVACRAMVDAEHRTGS